MENPSPASSSQNGCPCLSLYGILPTVNGFPVDEIPLNRTSTKAPKPKSHLDTVNTHFRQLFETGLPNNDLHIYHLF